MQGILTRAARARGIWAAGATALVCLVRAALPPPGPEAVGLASLADTVYTLALATTAIAIGVCVGRGLLGRIGLEDEVDPLESFVVSFGLGLGAVGLAVFGLGIAGMFRPVPIAALMTLAAAASARSAENVARDCSGAVAMLRGDWHRPKPGLYFVVLVTGLVALLALLLALAPPWAYDGLMYHLQAPRLFLEQGRVVPLPAILQANGPLLGQMLFGIGLALESDAFSQVVHLAFASALVLGLLAAGRRWIGPPGGWIAAGILVGIPIFPLWGTLAYVDMLQAFYEFMAVWAILRWRESPRWAWLVLSALLAGLALGTKQTALFMLPPMSIWLVILARSRGWGRALLIGLAYGVGASLLGFAWYAFSWANLGDPIYPFLARSADWPAVRVGLHLDYLRSFGTGRSPVDFLFLAWNLYFRHDAYAALMASIEFPSFLFPFALLVPVVRLAPSVRPLAGLSLLRLTTWYVGSQQTRFLLPIYPVWCVMAAAVLLAMEARLTLRIRPPSLSGAIVTGMVLTTFIYVAIYFFGTGPVPVILGTRPRRDFLSRMVYDYRAHHYVKATTPGTGKVLQLWDGQGFYCDRRCIQDAGQVMAPYLYGLAPTVEAMERELARRGVTHILLDLEGLNFLLLHDPRGTHLAAAEFFIHEFLPACGLLEYEDPKVQIHRLECQPSVGGRP